MQGKRIKHKNLIGISIVVLLLLVLFFLARQSVLFPIRTITVNGDYWHVSQTKIKNIVNRDIQGSFFSTSLPKIRANLLKELPWAKTVSASKQWPGIINITIEQKKAIAIWNGVALLQANGQLFYPLSTSFPKNIPVFIGESNTKIKSIDLYQKMTPVLLKDNVTGELKITRIKITPQGNCLVTFNNKTVVMLGDVNILALFSRFVAIYKQVFEKKQKIPEYVDMRYSHGLAVKWEKSS